MTLHGTTFKIASQGSGPASLPASYTGVDFPACGAHREYEQLTVVSNNPRHECNLFLEALTVNTFNPSMRLMQNGRHYVQAFVCIPHLSIIVQARLS